MSTPVLPAPASPPARGFNLTRRFSILSLACVVAVAGVLGHLFSKMLAERLLHREAVVTLEFVQSVVRSDESAKYLVPGAGAALPAPLEDTFRHFAEMPDVLRANVYSPERRAIWSSDAAIIGRQFGPNDDLDRSLRGELVYKSGTSSKEEHAAASKPINGKGRGGFIEIYVPILGADNRVAGVVELYKTPDALFEAIRDGQQAVALGAAVGGLLLYGALIGIVRRADAIMLEQQRRLVEGERLAVVGEMAAAVAHSIRNPLASIRTSVEDALDRDLGRFQEPAEDIMGEVDKIEAWVRELLSFSGPGSVRRETLDLNALIRRSLDEGEREIARRGVKVEAALAEPPPRATGDPALVEQVLQSIISNALDAMPRGGRLGVTTTKAEGRAEIEIRDNGTGIAPEALEQVFKPFFTTKPRGVGLGLPLSRRLVERMGGSLTLTSRRGEGTAVRIALPA